MYFYAFLDLFNMMTLQNQNLFLLIIEYVSISIMDGNIEVVSLTGIEFAKQVYKADLLAFRPYHVIFLSQFRTTRNEIRPHRVVGPVTFVFVS